MPQSVDEREPAHTPPARRFDLSIIIPTYQEANRIGPSLQQLGEYLKKHPGKVEVIVVDAHSPDGTQAKAKKYAKLFDSFSILDAGPKPAKRAIKGLQVKQGMLAAQGKYVMFMDADLATPLKYLSDVFELMKKNAPIGICVRNLGASHKGLRKLISSAGNFLVQMAILPGISDTQCGFKVFSAEAAQAIFPRQRITGWGFDMEILAIARQLGYQIDMFSVPDWRDVEEGSKLGGSKFSAARAALSTLPDVLKIKWRMLSGRYKKAIS